MRETEDHTRDTERALTRRAAKFLRKGEPRKAVLTLRELASLKPTGASYVRLAHVLALSGKRDEALAALRQALYCYRYDEQRGRARTVARLILTLDPSDRAALRRAA